VAIGLLFLLLCIVLSIGVANLLWLGIQALHPEYAYSPYRPHMSDDHLYTLGFIFLELAVLTVLIALVRKRIAALDLAAGATLFWLPVTIAATIVVPASSYLGTWVLMANSLALLLALAVRSSKHAEVLSGLGFLGSAVVVTWLWVPILYINYLGASAFVMLSLMVGLSACWLGAMAPTLDWIAAPKRWLFPAAALLAGVGLLAGGHFLVGRDSPPPLVNSIGYWFDPEHREPNWVAFIGGDRVDNRSNTPVEAAFPEVMDARQARLLVNPVRRPYTDLFPGAPPYSVLTNPAPQLSLDGPGLEVIADDWVADRRVTRLKVTASMRNRIYLIIPEGAPLLAITIPGERTELPPVDEEWVLRIDGMPTEGIEIVLESRTRAQIPVVIVEEKTGLPSFPGLDLETEPGTMPSPGEFDQSIPADFTAMYRSFIVSGVKPQE
jgi:hypothetical protein